MEPITVLNETLDLTLKAGYVYGHHSIWIPYRQLKIPFQWGGRLARFRDMTAPTSSVHGFDGVRGLSIWDEIAMLRALAEAQLAPPIGKVVYFPLVISEHPGAWWADPCGAYGYEMADANTLPPGRYTVAKAKAIGLISGNADQWWDCGVEHNVVNGYLIDVRRNPGDMLRWMGEKLIPADISEDANDLREAALDQGRFGDAKIMYQDIALLNSWVYGLRPVEARASHFGMTFNRNDSVVDLGCNLGGFLQYAKWRTDGPVVGVDREPKYLAMARRIARLEQMNICYRSIDFEDQIDVVIDWFKKLFVGGSPDHLLLLSIWNHIQNKDKFWRIIDACRSAKVYLESSAVLSEWPMRDGVEARHGTILKETTDLGHRRCYRLGPR